MPRSPLQICERLSEATGATVYLKREDLQTVRSYKLRGAHNLLMQLSDDEIAAGVVCSSAGNHAQGFAMACRSMGIHGRVYVPAKTPEAEARPHPLSRRRVHRADRRRKTYDEPRRPRSTTSRAPARRWFRRMTTRAPWPARAPSPPRSSSSSTANPTW